MTAAAPVAASNCQPVGELQRVSVRSVFDGDTVLLADGRRVRLIGLNAPESGRKGEPGQPGARAARAALNTLLAANEPVWLQPGVERNDRYGRLLAHLFVGTERTNVEAALLRQGLGWHVAVPPNVALTECLAAAEVEARQSGRGVWRNAPVAAVADRDPTEGGFALLAGRIEKVDESRHSWWLELDGPVVLRLDKRDLHYFPEIAPAALKGRHLQVRGWLSHRPGASDQGRKPLVMPLRHPAMLTWKSGVDL